jgi:hypothetical protein
MFTPRFLLDLLHTLPIEKQHEFWRLCGQSSSADVPILIAAELPLAERERFSKSQAWQETNGQVFNLMLVEAIRMAKEHPQLGEHDAIAELKSRVQEALDDWQDKIIPLDRAKVKRIRDRSGKAEIAIRNAQICDECKAAQGKKAATIHRLAIQHGLTPGTVKDIYRNRSRWWAERERLQNGHDLERNGTS